MKRCDRCDFWIKEKETHPAADCRRYPPTPFLKPAMNPITQEVGVLVNPFWPKTRPELWCGEYRRRARLIPFFRRLIARAILFCYGGEKCLLKEEPKNMPEGQKFGSMSTPVSPKRKPSLN